METKVTVVPEVLNDYNYPDWGVRMRTYLMARDLWEIVAVEPPKQQEDDKAWNTKNFMALHVIQNACGPQPFHVIRNIDSAKTAWDVLAATYNNIQPPPPETNQVVLEILKGKDNYLDWSARVRNYLMAKDIWDTIDIVKEPPKKNEDGAAFKAWRKKDLLALHVIQNACGPKAFRKIRYENSAKGAWRRLAAVFRPEPKEDTNIGVRELLDRDNYYSWSVRVRTYLELQDLWDVGEGKPDNSEAALNVIKKTCGPTMKSVIKECDSAKDAWKKLSEAAPKSIPWIAHIAPMLRSAKLHNRLRAAVVKRDWSDMMDCITENPRELVIAKISVDGNTVLHWAVLHDNTYIVRQLVGLMSKEELEAQNDKGMTALAQVAACGNIQMAEYMLQKNSNLISIADEKNRIPVLRAFEYGVTDIARYLYERTPLQVLKRDATYVPTVLVSCISVNAFDIALDLLQRSKSRWLSMQPDIYGNTPLSALASQPSISSSMSSLLFWERWIYASIPEQLVHSSTIKETWIDIDGQDQLQSHEVNAYRSGMLELATDQIERIPGAALEMRSELQWFKEIEGMSSLFTREMKNNLGETAKETFTKNHKNMKDAGEKWMKETASSSSVVGTLIITIAFATAITVPGGNNGDKGYPVFSDKPIFLLFVISNALSFVSSIAAVLTFLVILTTSYAEEHFISSLPKKMVIGLCTLSFAIATMMIAFCAALFIVMPRKLWITIFIICLASISIIWFLLEKYPNLVEITKSAYGPHMFDKKLKTVLSKGMPLHPIFED